MTISNQHGRAMEYVFSNYIKEYCKNKKLNFIEGNTAINSIDRDKVHFQNSSQEVKEDFLLFAQKLTNWIKAEYKLDEANQIFLDREIDTAGVKGNVIDVYLEIKYSDKSTKKINLSLKNHHDALKHPRIPRLPLNCGIEDKKILEEYKKSHLKVWEEFIKKSKELNPNATLFRELKEMDNDFIDNNLYIPLNTFVKNTFANYVINNENSTKKLFNFITGLEYNFLTVKNEKDKILIKKFTSSTLPNSFTIEDLRPNTFLLKFDNNWNISFRLHTASSRMFNKSGSINTSTKFDVKCENISEVIEIDEISKK